MFDFYNVVRSYSGLCMQYACYQAECEHRAFSWIDTRQLCTFKCRCHIHEINSVTARCS